MQLPEPALAVLREAGLTPAQWQRLRAALEAEPAVPAHRLLSAAASLQMLAQRLRGLEQQLDQERLSIAALDTGLAIPETWEALEEWWLRRMWTRLRHEGVLGFARHTGLSKTTLYRKLGALGLIDAAHPSVRLTQKADAILGEIETLTQSLSGGNQGGD